MPLITTEELDLLEKKPDGRSLSTEELDLLEQKSVKNPVDTYERAGRIYDTAIESNIPLSEAENLHAGIEKPKDESTGLGNRFRWGLYNQTVANVLHTIGMGQKEERGWDVPDIAEEIIRKREALLGWRERTGLHLASWYAEDYQTQKDEIMQQLLLPPEQREDEDVRIYSQYKEWTPYVNPFAYDITEPEKASEKVIDGITGIVGFFIQTTLLKRAAPSLSAPAIFEAVNLANGGKPGMGAGMYRLFGSIGKFIPGEGILPAVGRATTGGAILGTTTYLGGGDTVDILINIGLPFAFEGIGVTKQGWINYKNKEPIFLMLKQKAPALKDIDNIVTNKAITDLLGNVEGTAARRLMTKEEMMKQFEPQPAGKNLSEEIKDYMYRKRYDELLIKASEGDKKAVKKLNEMAQRTDLPTYDELLERGFNGDTDAFAQIQEGLYYSKPVKPFMPAPTVPEIAPVEAVGAKITAEPTVTAPETTMQKIDRLDTEIGKLRDASKGIPKELLAERESTRKQLLKEGPSFAGVATKKVGFEVPAEPSGTAPKARLMTIDEYFASKGVKRKWISPEATAEEIQSTEQWKIGVEYNRLLKEGKVPLIEQPVPPAAEAPAEPSGTVPVGEKIPPRPMVNPKATVMQQDKQIIAQQKWDKQYGKAEKERVYAEADKNNRRIVLESRAKRGEPVPTKLLQEFAGEEWADKVLAKQVPAVALQAKPEAKVIYTSVPVEWQQSKKLYDWGQKGLRAESNREFPAAVGSKKTRKTFIWSNEFDRVPVRLPRSTMDAFRAKTDEIWKVQNRGGEDYYLIPKKVLTDTRNQLGAEAFVQQEKPVRSPKQLINDRMKSGEIRKIPDDQIGEAVLFLSKANGLTIDELSEKAKGYIKEYENAKSSGKLTADISEGVAQKIPTTIEEEERLAIQQEQELGEVGDFLDGLIEEPQKPKDLFGQPMRPELEGGAAGEQTVAWSPEDYKVLAERERINALKDIEGQVKIPTKDYGKENIIVTKDEYKTIKERRGKETGRLKGGKEAGGTELFNLQEWSDFVKTGMYHIEAGVRTFADWSVKMVDEFGDAIKPYLKTVWEESQTTIALGGTAKRKYAKIQQERRLSPIEQAKATKDIAENDIKPPENISSEDLSKARERGFITSVKEILPQLKIENQYIPRSTDVLAIKARNLVIDNLAKAEKIAVNPQNDAGVAITSEVIKYYNEQAAKAPNEAMADMYYEKVATIANGAAFNLTEGGRFIQAASILSRMTPEGQVRFAAKEIQRYNKQVAESKGGLLGLKKRIPELTGDEAKYILKEMREISQMPEGKQKSVRFKNLQNHIGDLVPTPLYRKIITVWKAGLLTGIKTSGLNIFANVNHLGTEVVKDIPATMVDKVIAIFTGERAVTLSTKGLGKGGIEGAVKGWDYLLTGYDTRDVGTKFDYKRYSMGKGNLAKALQAYTQTVFRVLGTEDQPFYYAAKLRSLYEQAKVAAINQNLKGAEAQKFIDNLVQNPTEKMIKYAAKDAETAIFTNRTTLGDAARGIQKLPGGEIVVPFGRTPSAVAMQIINYSPVGIVKTIIENIGKGRFDQRAFSQGLGRGITGTTVLFIGAKLYSNGLMNLDRPKSEKERKLWELEGRQANTVKIGDKWRTVQSFGPVGNLLIIGGHFQRAFNECGSPAEAMSEALAGSAKSFTEQTFLRGLNQFTDALSDPERSATMVVGNTISSIIPTIVADAARATDVLERRADTIPQKFMIRMPGLREMLEPQITVLGEAKVPTANPLELMIDPTRPSQEISSPVINELRRLWDEGWEASPTLLGDKKGYKTLTAEENTKLWEQTGQLIKDALTMLFQNPIYKEFSDEKKADAISKIVTTAQTAARTEMVAEKLSGLKDDELEQMLFELRELGLATEDIIPIALSKRNPRKAKQE